MNQKYVIISVILLVILLIIVYSGKKAKQTPSDAKLVSQLKCTVPKQPWKQLDNELYQGKYLLRAVKGVVFTNFLDDKGNVLSNYKLYVNGLPTDDRLPYNPSADLNKIVSYEITGSKTLPFIDTVGVLKEIEPELTKYKLLGDTNIFKVCLD